MSYGQLCGTENVQIYFGQLYVMDKCKFAKDVQCLGKDNKRYDEET